MSPGNRKAFLSLPTGTIAKSIKDKGKPRVGIFVPDGNRRLVLSTTDLQENSIEFFAQLALTQAARFRDNLKVFFSHGLPTLFTPLFSHSVLARGTAYRRLTVLETLNILFTGAEWLEFYADWDVRVRVYGDLSILAQTDCEQVLQWIESVQQTTRTHASHTRFLGIGGESWVGHDALVATARFYKRYQREPSPDELIEFLYGRPVPLADFFIMCSKLAGVGALPALICGKDTQVYYLPVPSASGLTEYTYRAILYDLLCMRENDAKGPGYALDSKERKTLRTWYADHAQVVIGLGRRIGSVWVSDESGGSVAI